MVKYFELINRNTIKPAPNPLRIDGRDIITTYEAVYNANGYYRVEREPYPDDTEYICTPYYELKNNVITQKWEQGEKIEQSVSE